METRPEWLIEMITPPPVKPRKAKVSANGDGVSSNEDGHHAPEDNLDSLKATLAALEPRLDPTMWTEKEHDDRVIGVGGPCPGPHASGAYSDLDLSIGYHDDGAYVSCLHSSCSFAKDLNDKLHGRFVPEPEAEVESEVPATGPEVDADDGGAKPKGKSKPTAAKKNSAGYILDRNGQKASCPVNVKIWLGLNRAEDYARYDSFRQVILLDGKPLTDAIVVDLAMAIEVDLRVPWSQTHTRSALVHLSHQRSFSSLAKWLESLVWDKTARVDKFFAAFCGSEDDDYSAECSRIFFLSAVARGLKPGCQADSMVVLTGKQGIYKSTGLAALCPNADWFADDLGCDIFAAKAAEGLQGKWLFRVFRIRPGSIAQPWSMVKSFVTRRVDRYRPALRAYFRRTSRGRAFSSARLNTHQPLQKMSRTGVSSPSKVVQGNRDCYS